jgi:hypothetical protein
VTTSEHTFSTAIDPDAEDAVAPADVLDKMKNDTVRMLQTVEARLATAIEAKAKAQAVVTDLRRQRDELYSLRARLSGRRRKGSS